MKKGNKLKPKKEDLFEISFLGKPMNNPSDKEIRKRMKLLGFRESQGEFYIHKQVVYLIRDENKIVEESNDPLFKEILEKGRCGRVSVPLLDKN